MGVIGAISAIVLACFWIWWRFEAKVKEAEDKADEALKNVAKLELHVAQNYVPQAVLEKQTERLMSAIEGCTRGIQELGLQVTARIDALFHNQPAARRPRNSQD